MKKIVIGLAVVVLAGVGALFLFNPSVDDPELKDEIVGQDPMPEIDDLSAVDLPSLLAKSGEIDSIRYTVQMSSLQDETEMIVSLKGKQMRIEMDHQGQSGVFLLNRETGTAYNYMPNENMAMAMDMSLMASFVGSSLQEQSAELMNFNPVIIGRESLDGRSCLVIEYEVHEVTTRTWIWESYGLPLKTEAIGPEATMIALVESIDLSPLDDSLFELPAGVEIVNAPGL
jgi:hypothetical protein